MKKYLAGLCAIVLAVAGCSSTVNTVENAQKQSQRNMVSDMRVITDSGLNSTVWVVGVNTGMTPGGLLKVQVELQNRTGSPQRYTYRFEWFDSNGMQVNNVMSAVIPDRIEGGESKFVSGVAPTMDCRDFRLKLLALD